MKKESKEKLVEKNIKWGQVYTDKTQFLKDQFEAVVGPGSYFRFEGEAGNGDRYYCIVGPARVHHPKAKFFAGVRKLPATYSAGGKYFDSMDTAAKYAKETWGVPMPKELKPYTSKQLIGISGKVKKWKAEKEEAEKHEDAESFTVTDLTKEGMAQKMSNRQDYVWQTYESIVSGGSEYFDRVMETNPTVKLILNDIREEIRQRYAQYELKYGFTPEQMRDIFRVYVGYNKQSGLNVVYAGSYLMDKHSMTEFYDKARLYPGGDEGVFFDGQEGEDVPNDVLAAIIDYPNDNPENRDEIRLLKNKTALYWAHKAGLFNAFNQPYHHPQIDKLNQLKGEILDKRNGTSFNQGLPQEAEPIAEIEEEFEKILELQDAIGELGVGGVTPAAEAKQDAIRHQINQINNRIDALTDPLTEITKTRLKIKQLSIGKLDDEKRQSIIDKNHYLNDLLSDQMGLSLREGGGPIVQPFTDKDFSIAFRYSDGKVKKASNKNAKAGCVIDYPGNEVGMSYPDNHDGGPHFKNVSVDNLEQMKDMIVGKGSEMSLNRSGQNKAMLNILASVPEIHDEMFRVMRNYRLHGTKISNYLDPNIASYLSNMNNLVYFMTGQGEVSEGSVNAYNNSLSYRKGRKKFDAVDQHFNNGVPSRDTAGSNSYYREMGSFVRKSMELALGNMKIRMNPEEYQAIEDKFKGVKGLFSYVTNPKHEAYGVAKTNAGMQVRPELKNEWILIDEIAQIMKAHRMEDVGDDEKEIIANTLNSRKGQKFKKRREYKPFNKLNIDRFIQKIVKMQTTQDAEGNEVVLPIAEAAELVTQTAYSIDQTYRTGKGNKRDVDMFNIRRDPRTGGFKTYGGFKDYHSTFSYISELVEVTSEESSASEGNLAKDPVTRAYLPRYDLETGESLYGEAAMIFRTPPPTNMSAGELEAIYMGRPPEDRANFYHNQSALVDVIEDMFSVENIDTLMQARFMQQLEAGEVNEDILEQGVDQEVADAPERPVEGEPGVDENADMGWQFEDDEDDEEGVDLLEQMRRRQAPQPAEGDENFPVVDNNDEEREGLNRDGGNYFVSTLNSLVKISEELDKEGKTKDSLEILKLAHKFSNRLKRG